MRRILLVLGLTVMVGAGAVPASAQDVETLDGTIEPADPAEVPPPPASFDAGSITTILYNPTPDGSFLGSSGLDGSRASWAAPAREGAVRVAADAWVQPVHETCDRPACRDAPAW